jgi:hypothetical protein
MGLPDAIKSSRRMVNEAVPLPNVSHVYLKLLAENEKKNPVECDFKCPYYEFISAFC